MEKKTKGTVDKVDKANTLDKLKALKALVEEHRAKRIKAIDRLIYLDEVMKESNLLTPEQTELLLDVLAILDETNEF